MIIPASPSPASVPFKLPPGDIPLGSPHPAVQPPKTRASLLSNERLKGDAATSMSLIGACACSCSGAGKARVQTNRSVSLADASSYGEAPQATDDTDIVCLLMPPRRLRLHGWRNPPTEAPNSRDASVAVPDGQADTGRGGRTDGIPQGPW